MIQIIRLELINYNSWEHLELYFEQGLNVFRGDSGSGKSTIHEALYWGFTGICLKGGKGKEVGKDGSKHFGVIVDFEKDGTSYKVTRNQRDLHLAVNNELHDTHLHKKDLQEEIYKILGHTQSTLIHGLVFGQGINAFSSLSAKGKRDLLKEFFDTSWLDKMKDLNMVDLRELETIRSGLDSSIISTDYNISLTEERINSQEQKKKSFKENIQVQVDGFEKQIRASKELIENKKPVDVPDELGTFDDSVLIKLKDRLSDYKVQTISAKNHIEHLEEGIQDAKNDIKEILSNSLPNKCSQCGSDIDITEAENIRQITKEERETSIEGANLLIKECRDTIKHIEGLMQDLPEKIAKEEASRRMYEEASRDRLSALNYNKGLEGEIKKYKSQIENMVQEISFLKKQKFDGTKLSELKDNLKSYKKQKKEAEGKLKKVSKELEIKLWWSKHLGATGISSYIFQEMISSFSVSVKEYISMFGMDIDFSVDNSMSTPKFQIDTLIEGKILPYHRRSGGQKRVLDLCIYLGMKKLLPSKFNIMFIDEPMVNTDPKQQEIIYQILRQESQDKSVNVITHQELDVYGGLNIVEIENLK